tara:strand:- start:1065 stop:1325 length:261 start_codon:yes stop_codon:yes gene_type:complete
MKHLLLTTIAAVVLVGCGEKEPIEIKCPYCKEDLIIEHSEIKEIIKCSFCSQKIKIKTDSKGPNEYAFMIFAFLAIIVARYYSKTY